MQLNVFSTDSEKNGFRLQFMEVYNWGTFDEQIHTINPAGDTSLLTGSNGSGKTTFIDALLTLVVPEKRYRFYNQSSGSEKKGDRTEESYVMGGYGTVNNEANGTTKSLYLREKKEETYSILLANFANEAEQDVTLFQVRYFSNGDMKRVFGISHRELHIGDDFTPFDFNNAWKKRLEQRYNKGNRKLVEWFDAASKYAARMVDVMGMQSAQALQLFNQTVGIKVLGNLDEFIRTHMLEPRNMEDQFQELKGHLTTLLDAQRNIDKTAVQIEMLEKIKDHYQAYSQHRDKSKQLQQQLDTAVIWNSYTKNALLAEGLEANAKELKLISKRLAGTRDEIDVLLEKERSAQNLVEKNKAGQVVQQLEKDIIDLEKSREAAMQQLQIVHDWCQALPLKEKEVNSEAAFNRIIKDAGRVSKILEHEQRLNDEDEYDAKRTKEKALSGKEELEKEIELLHQSKNNIPPHLVNLRKEICQSLKVDPNEILFAGELMQVAPEELDWQPALEKLLHSFALRLLVPDKYYKKVTHYVNNNNLRTRLVFNRIHDDVIMLVPGEDTVYHKLEFHPSNKLAEWVKHQVIQQFDHVCVENEKLLGKYDKAITINGLIKNYDRHEKDDRQEKNDPSRYVMGWNNEKKKEALILKRNKLGDDLQSANDMLQTCKHRSQRLQKQFYALSRLQELPGYDALDVAKIQKQIHKLHEQVASLRKENKELDALKLQLQELKSQKDATNEKHTQLIRDEALVQQEIQAMLSQQEMLSALLQHVTDGDKDALLQFQQQHGADLGELNLQNIDRVYQQLKQDKEQSLKRSAEDEYKEKVLLDRAIGKLKNPSPELLQQFPGWLADVQPLSDDAQHAGEYLEWLDRLVTENLPRYKKDFENYINITITYKIGGLNEEIEKWERDINNNIKKLNESLKGINFNRHPETYIELGKRPVPSGTEIKEFKNRLLDALPQTTNWQQESFENKAMHFQEKVAPLISLLDENEAYRSRVMDVRNWFEFWADERYRDTGEVKKTYRQMGQLSGGEKAQLTYTILCSAIAYQFGITREGKNARSLRFIAVDESFSNQDEEKATYLMELCKQLHLQLLVVTPSDKIQVVQNFIAHVHLVQRVNNRHSVLYNMTIKELQENVLAGNGEVVM